MKIIFLNFTNYIYFLMQPQYYSTCPNILVSIFAVTLIIKIQELMLTIFRRLLHKLMELFAQLGNCRYTFCCIFDDIMFSLLWYPWILHSFQSCLDSGLACWISKIGFRKVFEARWVKSSFSRKMIHYFLNFSLSISDRARHILK